MFYDIYAQFKDHLKESVVPKILVRSKKGCAIVQVVSRWLPTTAARVCAWSGHVEFVVDKVAWGQVFSEYFNFPCQSSFHQILHHNHPGQVQ
jgi:hypothetical protein